MIEMTGAEELLKAYRKGLENIIGEYKEYIAANISALWGIPYEDALKIIDHFLKGKRIPDDFLYDLLRVLQGIKILEDLGVQVSWREYLRDIKRTFRRVLQVYVE